MILNRVKLERGVTFIKEIAGVVLLIFTTKSLTWNKMVLLASKSLKLLELVEKKQEKTFSKYI